MADADVAVYGKVLSREPTGARQPSGIGEEYRYRFRVIEAYKGKVRRRITLVGHTDTGMCGAGLLDVGDRFGLLLDGRRGPWKITTASFVTREELRSVRAPRRP